MRYEIFINRKGNWESLGQYAKVTEAWKDAEIARKHYDVKFLDLGRDEILNLDKRKSVS